MPISKKLKESMQRSSFIRKMFEEGARLKKEYGAQNVYDFSIGNPDLAPPPALHLAIKNILENSGENIHGYMPNAGFLKVRGKIALKASQEQSTIISAASIVMTIGAAGGLNVIMKTLLNKGDQVIVPSPYFVEYGTYIDNHNGEMVLVDTNTDFTLNVDIIEKSLSEKTKAILINSPHNPTGVVYSAEKIKQLAALLDLYYAKTGQVIYLIADEPYREIIYDDISVPPILSSYKNSLIVTSYSKTLSIPGERIGYIAVNPAASDFEDIIAGLTICNRTLGFVNAPALMQLAISEVLDEKVDIALYKKRRDLLMQGLTEAGIEFVLPRGAFYIFCKSPIKDDIEFVNNLKKFKILAVPGSGFGAPGYFRLAYCVSETIIQNSIPAFKAAMQKYV